MNLGTLTTLHRIKHRLKNKKLSNNGEGSYGGNIETMVWREIDPEKEEGMMFSWNRRQYGTAEAQSSGKDSRGRVDGTGRLTLCRTAA